MTPTPAGKPAATPHAITEFPSTFGLLLRGLTRRCAWCGDWRAFFLGWFKRQKQCRNCGHGYRRGDEAFELGAVTANIILTFGSILISILVTVVLTAPDFSIPIIVGVACAIALLGPLLFYPVSYTLWQAIDLIMRAPTPGELAGEGDATL